MLFHIIEKNPRGGLDILTDRDQRSIFFFWGGGGGLDFENVYFFGTGRSRCIFFGKLNKCCLLKCFIFLTVFFGSSFMYQVLQ